MHNAGNIITRYTYVYMHTVSTSDGMLTENSFAGERCSLTWAAYVPMCVCACVYIYQQHIVLGYTCRDSFWDSPMMFARGIWPSLTWVSASTVYGATSTPSSANSPTHSPSPISPMHTYRKAMQSHHQQEEDGVWSSNALDMAESAESLNLMYIIDDVWWRWLKQTLKNQQCLYSH